MCALAQPQDGVIIEGKRFDFETCEEINLAGRSVRCMCVAYDACRVLRCALVFDLPPTPPSPRMSLTLHAATGGGRRHSAAVCEPGPIQAPEEDQLGKTQGHVRGGGGV